MACGRKLGLLAMAVGMCLFVTVQQGAWAQQPASPQAAPAATPQTNGAPATSPQPNGAPAAAPNPAARGNGAVTGGITRKFGSAPDDPGPLAKGLSPKLKPKAVAAAMRKVADWQLAQSQQYFAAFDRSKQLDGEIWTWGALYSGLMAMSESLGDPKYANVMRETGKAYNWELSKTEGDANQQSMAQTFLELYLMDKKPEELAPTQKRYDAILAGPRVEVGSTRRIEWWWCDALFMGPPSWARLYAATGDKKYITYLDEEWAKTSQELWDPTSHLYFRDTTFITAKEKNGQKVFWSRGEGWVMAGLARTLQYLPKDDPARAMYETQLKEMAAAVANIQGPDGLMALGNARPGIVRPAGGLRLRADDVRHSVGHQQRPVRPQGLYPGGEEGVGGNAAAHLRGRAAGRHPADRIGPGADQAGV